MFPTRYMLSRVPQHLLVSACPLSQVSRYLQEKIVCFREFLPQQSRLAKMMGVFIAQQSCSTLLVYYKSSALPIICHYFPKRITLQISCSPGADLLQEKHEDPLTLNKIKGEQRNSHKLCWCFSAALGFPLLPSMEGKNSSPSSPRADPLKQPTHMAWGRDSPARQLNFSKVTPLNKKTTT